MPANHFAECRQRDQAIDRRLRVHPCTTQQLLDFFTSRQAGYRRITKLRQRGKIRHVGTVMRKGFGRPQDVYCNGWRPQADQLRHEVLLTEFLLLYAHAVVRRGYAVDAGINADAELRFAGRETTFYVELDTGEMSYRQVERRWDCYAGVKDYLLVVAMSERRLEGLKAHGDAVASIALFTTLDKAVADAGGRIWVDCFGNSVALPAAAECQVAEEGGGVEQIF